MEAAILRGLNLLALGQPSGRDGRCWQVEVFVMRIDGDGSRPEGRTAQILSTLCRRSFLLLLAPPRAATSKQDVWPMERQHCNVEVVFSPLTDLQ